MDATMNDFWRNKETGETVILERIYQGYRNGKLEIEFDLRDNNGNCLDRIPESEFNEKYERVITDFSWLMPNLLEYVLNDPGLSPVLMKFARRLHPGGYFHVGDYVYILSIYLPEPVIESGENRGRPYKVVSIDDVDLLTKMLTIIPKEFYESEDEGLGLGKIKIPLYLNTFKSNDAYTCLHRYDLPY